MGMASNYLSKHLAYFRGCYEVTFCTENIPIDIKTSLGIYQDFFHVLSNRYWATSELKDKQSKLFMKMKTKPKQSEEIKPTNKQNPKGWILPEFQKNAQIESYGHKKLEYWHKSSESR